MREVDQAIHAIHGMAWQLRICLPAERWNMHHIVGDALTAGSEPCTPYQVAADALIAGSEFVNILPTVVHHGDSATTT